VCRHIIGPPSLTAAPPRSIICVVSGGDLSPALWRRNGLHSSYRLDPSVGVLVAVQNTLVINALLRWGNNDIKQRYLPRLAPETIAKQFLG
jgi:hypothetical protein